MTTPLLFVGHGNPENALKDNQYTRQWQKIGSQLTPPKAIVVLSAHWLTSGSFVTASPQAEIIYDFFGFPEELYQVKYPAPGSPEIAASINQLQPQITLDPDGVIDHGAWTVLKRMFPEANIPVLQISIDYTSPPQQQIELLKNLRPLRDQGILFIGSGNIVHNLSLASHSLPPYDWALDFENVCKNLIAKNDLDFLLNYESLGPSALNSIPTNDHYRPMLNTLALKFDHETPEFFNQGIDLASVSMLSFIYNPHP